MIETDDWVSKLAKFRFQSLQNSVTSQNPKNIFIYNEHSCKFRDLYVILALWADSSSVNPQFLTFKLMVLVGPMALAKYNLGFWCVYWQITDRIRSLFGFNVLLPWMPHICHRALLTGCFRCLMCLEAVGVQWRVSEPNSAFPWIRYDILIVKYIF